ncbi:LCP family protein [Elusimicrobiota bacterium]
MRFRIEHLLLSIVIILAGSSIYFSSTSSISNAIKKSAVINGVVIVTETKNSLTRCDTSFFISYSPEKRFLNIISLPKKARFKINDKVIFVNKTFADNFKNSKNIHSASLDLRNTLEQVFQNKLAIPYYLQIERSNIERLINSFGGINIVIENPIDLYDENKGLYYRLNAGKHRMNGEQLLKYLSYKDKIPDVSLVLKQQLFFKSFLIKSRNPFFLTIYPKFIFDLLKYATTNLSLWDFFVLSAELKDLDFKNIRLTQIPGYDKGRNINIDIKSTIELLDKIFLYNKSASFQGPKVRVEVWNASGEDGLAQKVTWMLRENGYDVVEWGNFSVIQNKTLVKDLSGDLRTAQELADFLNCGEIITRFDSNRFADVSIILGKDCDINTK